MVVEIDGIMCCLGGILVAEGLQELGGISDRGPGAEEVSEVFDERRIAVKPIRVVVRIIKRRTQLGLEPVQGVTLEVGDGKGDPRLIIQEVRDMSREVHQTLEDERLYLTWIGPIESIGAPGLDSAFRLGIGHGSDPPSQQCQCLREFLII